MYPIARVLLGGFIVWQLLFILGSNFVPLILEFVNRKGNLIKDEGTKAPAAADKVAKLDEGFKTWSELTGQLQGWSLYAPNVPRHSTFVAVDFGWDDNPGWTPGPAKVISSSEPANPRQFFRPFGTFRLPSYEANLGLVMWNWDEDSASHDSLTWRERIEESVRKQGKPMRAYVQWQHRMFQKNRPDLSAPSQAILLVRMYTLPVFGSEEQSWGEAIEHPIARCHWKNGPNQSGTMELESYDPLTKQFRALPIEE